MDIGELVGRLRSKDVKLWIDQEDLSVDAPRGALLPDDLEQLRAHKPDIIRFLKRFRNGYQPPRLTRQQRGEWAPLSFAQQRLWIVEQQPGEGVGAAYHIPMAVKLHGKLDREALVAALNTMVMRHESLRTTFVSDSGNPVQVIAAEAAFSLLTLDLSARPPSERALLIEQHVVEEAHARFDLGAGPLMRGRLLRLGSDEHVLLVTMHHIISDGWSLSVLNQEMSTLYAAFREGRPNPLPSMPVQYADYAQWQRQWLHGPVLEEQLAYWREQLVGAPLLDLPRDRPRPAIPSFKGATHAFPLPLELSEQLRSLAASSGATLFMTLLAVFDVLLSWITAQNDIAISSDVAGRHHAGTEGLVGFFVSNVVLRVQLNGRSTFRELLSQVKSVVLGAYAHQDMPFEHLVAQIRPNETGSAADFRRVTFKLENATHDVIELPGLTLEPVMMEHTTAKAELALTIWETTRELYGTLEYATDLFDASTVERVARSFVVAAAQVAAHPDTPLAQLDLALPEPQDASLSSPQYLRDRRYWTENWEPDCAVGLCVHVLPTGDRPWVCRAATLPMALVQALNEYGSELDIEFDHILIAAAVLFMHRMSAAGRLSIGVPRAGLTADVLPVCFDIDPGATFTTHLLRTSKQLRAALNHGRLSQEQIRRLHELAANEVLFKTTVEVLFPKKEERESPEFSPAPPTLDGGELNIRMAVDLEESEVEISFDGSPRCFEGWELESHLSAFVLLLKSLTEAVRSGAPVGVSPLLSASGTRRILKWSAGTHAIDPPDVLLHTLVQEQVEREPSAVAVLLEAQQLTYAQLNGKANQLARRLGECGVKAGDLVGICSERSLEMPVALLAILKAGAAYVPLDPGYPAERLSYMLEDARIRVLLTQSHILPGLSVGSEVQALCLDTQMAALESYSDTNPDTPGHSQSLAYCIYTSGSTGRPKGVMISHAAIVNHMLWMRETFALTSADRVLQKTPFSFDASVWEFWLPLLTGGCCVLAPQGEEKDPDALWRCVKRHGITVLQTVPSLLRMLLGSEESREGRNHLRYCFCGGEALEPDLADAVLRGWKGELWNLYGPTEATIDAVVAPIPSDAVEAGIPIGCPIRNITARILNADLQLVPIGAAGELCIAGIGLARGYVGRPDLTAERFIADPFGRAGERLYRTGDRARCRADGRIEYLGRNDGQVKIRGYRIELGEVEAQLRQFPGVRNAAVLARKDELGEMRLIAYFSGDESLQAGELHQSIRGRLPQYMLPTAYVRLDQLPQLPNGKLDRKALPAPGAGATRIHAYEAPEGELEVALAAVWREVLNVERVGRHDNFFESGGSSIRAIEAMGLAGQAGIYLGLKEIFEQQSVARLAALISQDPSRSHAIPRKGFRRDAEAQSPEAGSVSGPFPFTPAELNVIRSEGDDFRHYRTSLALKSQRPLSPQLLGRALQFLATYHDVLRLRVVREDSRWTQEIVPVSELESHETLPCETSSFATLEELRAAINPTLERLSQDVDLARPPLLRAAILKLSAGSQEVVLLASHHFATDPISWGILVENLEAIYEALESQRPVRLPLKGTSYKEWAEKLSTYANSDSALHEASYWQQVPWDKCTPLRVDHDTETQQPGRCASICLEMSETRALMSDAGRVHGVHINEILVAALANALASCVEQHTLCINLFHHGRVNGFEGAGHMNVSRTVGWFSAAIPLLLEVQPGAAMKTTLRTVEHRLRTLPNEGVGYSVLRHLREGWKESAVAPPSDVLLNHQGVLSGGDTNRLFATQFDTDGYAESLIQLNLPWKLAVLSNIAADRLNAHFVSRVYRQTTLERIADDFLHNLRELIGMSRCVAASG